MVSLIRSTTRPEGGCNTDARRTEEAIRDEPNVQWRQPPHDSRCVLSLLYLLLYVERDLTFALVRTGFPL